MKILGLLSYFLGMEALRTDNGLFLHQMKYSMDLLSSFKMDGCKPISTPFIVGRKLSKNDENPLPDNSEYRNLVGYLQYLTMTRPDVPYGVNQVSQFLHSPTTSHLEAAKSILRYIKGTIDYGLQFTLSTDFRIHAFSDLD